MAGEHRKKKRMRGLQKRGAGKHGGGPSGPATTQGASLGHGRTIQGMLKILVRSSSWSNGGPTGAIKKVTKRLSVAANAQGTQFAIGYLGQEPRKGVGAAWHTGEVGAHGRIEWEALQGRPPPREPA